MEQNNRYDRYQDDDNRSSNYRRQQYNRTGRDFDDAWDDDQSGYQGQSKYSGQRGSSTIIAREVTTEAASTGEMTGGKTTGVRRK